MQVKKNAKNKKVNLIALITLLVVLVMAGGTFAWLAFRDVLADTEGITGKIVLTTQGMGSIYEEDAPICPCTCGICTVEKCQCTCEDCIYHEDSYIVSGSKIVENEISFKQFNESSDCFIRVKAMLITEESLTESEQAWLDEVNATFIEPITEQNLGAITYVDWQPGGLKLTITNSSLIQYKPETFNDIILFDKDGDSYTGLITNITNKNPDQSSVYTITGIPSTKIVNGETRPVEFSIHDDPNEVDKYSVAGKSGFAWMSLYTWTQSWGGYYYLVESVGTGGQTDEDLVKVPGVDVDGKYEIMPSVKVPAIEYVFCNGVQIPYDATLFYEESAISLNLKFRVEVQAIQYKNLKDHKFIDDDGVEKSYLNSQDKLKRSVATKIMNATFNESFVEMIVVKFDTTDYSKSHAETLGAPIVRPVIVKKYDTDTLSDERRGKFVFDLPRDPEWRSKRFDGWYTDKECTVPYKHAVYDSNGDCTTANPTPIYKNTTLYAKWTQLVYLRFEYMSGQSTSAGTLKYDGYYDETKRLPVVYKSLSGLNEDASDAEKGVTLIWFTENGNLASKYYLGGAKIKFNAGNGVEVQDADFELPQEYQFELLEETTLYGAWYYTGAYSEESEMLYPFNAEDCVGVTKDTTTGSYHISKYDGMFENVYMPSLMHADGVYSLITSLKGASESVPVFGDVNARFNQLANSGSRVNHILYGTTVTEIGQYTFVNCPKLKTLHIPYNIKTIKTKAIHGCEYLQRVEIGDSVDVENKTTLEAGSISDCYVLTSVKFYKNISSIDGKIFTNCNSVCVIEFEDIAGVTLSDNAFEFNKVTIETDEYVQVYEIVVGQVDEDTLNLYKSRFGNVVKLQTIFYGHDENGNAYRAEEGAAVMIGLVRGTTMLVVPNNVICGGYNYRVQTLGVKFTDGSINDITLVAFNDYLQEIREKAFELCGSITKINLPKSLLYIKRKAFESCTNLAEVNISSIAKLKVIEKQAFLNCEKLTSFIIPENIEQIDSYILQGCSRVSKINYYAANNDAPGSKIDVNAFELEDSTKLYNYRVYVKAEHYADLVRDDLKHLLDYDDIVGDYENTPNVPGLYTDLINGYKNKTLSGEPEETQEERLYRIFRSIKNYVRSFEEYNVAFVQNDILLNDEQAIYSIDTLIHMYEANGNTELINKFKNSGIRYGDVYIFTESTYADDSFEGWNTKINACGDAVVEGMLFGEQYSEKTLYAIAKLLVDSKLTFVSAMVDLDDDPATPNEKVYKIKGYTGSNPVFDIPNRYKGSGDSRYYPVIEIMDNAFKGNTKVVRLTMLPGVQRIGISAFEGCTGLTSIVLATELETIDQRAFYGCKKLENITMANTVKDIKYRAFYNCVKLRSIVIPANVKTVGQEAFYGCTNLITASFVNSSEVEKEIGASAFYSCTSLRSVKLPVAVRKINTKAFYKCTNLFDVDLSQCIYMYELPSEVFSGCSKLDTVRLPDSIEIIGEKAFYNCAQLITLNLPENLTTIYTSAFEKCGKMQVVDLASTAIVKIYPKAFYECEYAFFDLDLSQNITLTMIGAQAFYGCKNMRTLILPNVSVTSGNEVFKGCSKLESVIIRTTGILSNKSTFSGCVLLESVQIASQDQVIGDNSFFGCEMLSVIYFPRTVATVGVSALEGCGKVTLLDFSATKLKSIGNKAFNGCISLSTVYFSNDKLLETIGSYAFGECVLLSDLDLGNKLKSLGEYAFSNCSSLGTVKLPTTLTSVGGYVFYNIPKGTITIDVLGSTSGWNANWNKNGIGSETVWDNP